MPEGVAVYRHWVFILKDGLIVIDWGENCFQELVSGEFHREVDLFGSHTIQEDELVWLKRTRQILDYDAKSIYVAGLPENPRKLLD